MSDAAREIEPRFSWKDYRTWSDDKRWEIVAGEAYDMSPSPSSRHQLVVAEMLFQMMAYFRGKPCRVLGSPMDVVLSDEDVVQPDILVVCNPDQIRPTHIDGPPAVVVEIVSPSSQEHDRVRKTRLYASAGVKEYWIVTPWPSSVEVLVLDGPTYRLQAVLGKNDELVSHSFPELKIRLANVFNFPLEPHEQPKAVREPPARYTAVG